MGNNMEDRKYEDAEIDLKEIFSILRKRRILIFLITLLVTVSSGIFSILFITPIYQASTEILVNKSESEQTYLYNINDINTNLKLISTYNVIITSPRIIDLVIEKHNVNLTNGELVNKIKVSTVKDSQVMKITVEDENHSEAVKLANAIATIFQREIVEIMNVDNVQILTSARNVDNPSPVKPNIKLNIAVALIIGLMISVGLAFLLEYLDNTLKTEQDVERILGYPVLGIISTIEDEKPIKKRHKRKRNDLKQEGEAHEA